MGLYIINKHLAFDVNIFIRYFCFRLRSYKKGKTMTIKGIIKRDASRKPFKLENIRAILKAMRSSDVERVFQSVPHFQIEMNEFLLYSSVEEIQDVVEQTLMQVISKAAKSYIEIKS